MKYIIVQLDVDSGDIGYEEFASKEAADAHLEANDGKAYLIVVNGSYKIEDHT